MHSWYTSGASPQQCIQQLQGNPFLVLHTCGYPLMQGVMPVAVLTLGFVGAMFVFFVLLNQRRVSAVIQQQKRK